MKRTQIAEIYRDAARFDGKQLTLGGWARTIRASNLFGFIELNDGSCFKNLQIVFEDAILDNYKEIAKQNVGAALVVQGTLVLTPEAAVEQADSIKVTLGNGNDVSGHMKQKDAISGQAIVSISVQDISATQLRDLEPIPLGNSYQVQQGDLIAAVGSPAGVVHSMDYGFVSYVVRSNPMVDQHCRMLYSNILADAGKGTFLVNTDGELVGWAQESDSPEASDRVTEVFGISDYKGVLEKLSNGQAVPCIGIVGQEVTDAQVENGLPAGIYVMNAVTDKPAYNAGIQNGDILTELAGEPVTSMKEYQAALDKMTCGQVVHVTVARNGRDTYTELEFDVTVGSR